MLLTGMNYLLFCSLWFFSCGGLKVCFRSFSMKTDWRVSSQFHQQQFDWFNGFKHGLSQQSARKEVEAQQQKQDRLDHQCLDITDVTFHSFSNFPESLKQETPPASFCPKHPIKTIQAHPLTFDRSWEAGSRRKQEQNQSQHGALSLLVEGENRRIKNRRLKLH